MQSLDSTTTTLICPQNDGEAAEIIKLAKRYGFDVRISQQKWGATLDQEPAATLLNLNRNVVIVEMPAKEKEKELKKNHTLFIIDHHKYGALDRSNKKSSLEQFAELIAHTLNRDEMGIALNDRGYIPALLAHGYTENEVNRIRHKDFDAQGYESEDFPALEREYANGAILGGLYVVATARERTSYLGDIHFWKNAAREHKLDLLICKFTPEAQVHELSFSGAPSVAKRLFKLLGGFCGGDENVSMYWGKKLEQPMAQEVALQQVDAALM